MANRTDRPSIVGRIAFWIIGLAYCLCISILPAVLLGWWFYTGGVVHARVVPVVAVLFVLLWLVSMLTGGRSSANQSGAKQPG